MSAAAGPIPASVVVRHHCLRVYAACRAPSGFPAVLPVHCAFRLPARADAAGFGSGSRLDGMRGSLNAVFMLCQTVCLVYGKIKTAEITCGFIWRCAEKEKAAAGADIQVLSPTFETLPPFQPSNIEVENTTSLPVKNNFNLHAFGIFRG